MSLLKLAAIVTLLLAGVTASVTSYVESRGAAVGVAQGARPAPERVDGAGVAARRGTPAPLVLAGPAAEPSGEALAEVAVERAAPAADGAAACEAFERELEAARATAEEPASGDPSRWQRVRRSGRDDGPRPGATTRAGEPAAAPSAPAAAPTAPTRAAAGSARPTMSGPI